jgi:signal transduction histidine kinase
MHFQEVFRAIYSNHIYEYIIINEDFKVVEYSDKSINYCDEMLLRSNKPDIFELLPELFGMDEKLKKLLYEKTSPILLHYIFKEPDFYINIRVHQGRHRETLIVLLENVTDMANMEQTLIQDRNEKSLLLDELAEKNRQLQVFNEKMQELVEQETKKNLEKQKMLELSSRHAQMGEIIGMITHQWKQPLSIINMSCTVLKISLLKGKFTDELLEKRLGDIEKQVKHMDTTVMDFQNFFNPRKEKHIFSIKKTIQTIIDLVKNEYVLNNIEIELIGDENIRAEGYANEYNQVVLSILKNAKDVFIKDPHDNMKIVVNIESKNNKSYVSIRDNAGGIPEDIIDNIFDLYMSTKKDGSGLGLNISKNIIEINMNGKLKVQNVDDGAEFIIIL